MSKYSFFFVLICFFGNAQNQLTFTDVFKSNSKNNVSCYRIPSLVTAPNGDLIAAIDERISSCGDLKWNRNINIVLKISNDNGETWSETKRVIDYPLGESASDPSMIVDRYTNEIFLFFNYMDLDKNKDIYIMKYVKSVDNGKSWSKPIDITSKITKPEWSKDFMFITSGRGIQTSDGTLLHCLVNLKRGTHVFGSKDHGKNWFLIDNPLLPGDESKIIELKNKKWIVNSRVNKKGYRYTHITNDLGKTWISKANKNILDPGCNASIINYKNQNVLLFSNANDSINRINLSIRFSDDDGESWSNPKTIYAGNSAYSSMTVLEDGWVGIIFEKDDYTTNAFVKFPLEWVKSF